MTCPATPGHRCECPWGNHAWKGAGSSEKCANCGCHTDYPPLEKNTYRNTCTHEGTSRHTQTICSEEATFCGHCTDRVA